MCRQVRDFGDVHDDDGVHFNHVIEYTTITYCTKYHHYRHSWPSGLPSDPSRDDISLYPLVSFLNANVNLNKHRTKLILRNVKLLILHSLLVPRLFAESVVALVRPRFAFTLL